jgi:hypothetical protein
MRDLLIHDDIILTAAHCQTCLPAATPLNECRISVQEECLGTSPRHEDMVQIPHPSFNPYNLRYDIMLSQAPVPGVPF